MLSKRELNSIKKRMKLFPGEYKIVGNRAYTINDFTGEWTEITGTESSKPMKIKDEVCKGTIKLKKFSEIEDNNELAQLNNDNSKK